MHTALRSYISSGPENLDFFFKVSLPLADLLVDLHQRGEQLGLITTSDISIETGTGELDLSGLGDKQCIPANGFTEEKIPYVPPEKTGRMNLWADHRSDFYSLGVIFYELLTGRLPFDVQSTAEWIHAHLARQPDSICLLNPLAPEALGQMVTKMLEKDPANRYQSARGLKADLTRCFSQWREEGMINAFVPGEEDFCSAPVVSGVLFGRREEIALLTDIFRRVAGGSSELVCITGFPGTGKTALANEVRKTAGKNRAYFVAGKVDLLKRDIPYAPLAQAFQELICRILATSPQEIAKWQKRLRGALGADSQVITDIIPEVKLLLGEQAPSRPLPPAEAKSRVQSVFRKFTGAFAGKEHPLIIFLDDLQWVDRGTLSLMRSIITDPGIKYLQIIIAYRENEVITGSPLVSVLEELEGEGLDIRRVCLEPLDYDNFCSLLADSLKPSGNLDQLAGVLYRKTAGNPFYFRQILQDLGREKMIYFDFNNNGWNWNLERIEKTAVSDDVGSLLASKVRKLSDRTTRLLQLAACIGNTFTLNLLAEVSGDPITEVMEAMREAAGEGLLLPADSGLYSGGSAAPGDNRTPFEALKFVHDQVQQAAYNLLPEERRQETHLRIGWALERQTAGEPERNIFEIIDQLNLGRRLITGDGEKKRLAGYNLIAGKKAREATAFTSAINYLQTGLDLLPAYPWLSCFDLNYELHFEIALSEHFCGNPDVAEQLFDRLFTWAQTPMQRVEIIKNKLEVKISLGEYRQAIELGKEALGQLGEALPDRFVMLHMLKEFLQAKYRLRLKDHQSLLELPPINDTRQLKVMEILASLVPPISVHIPNLLPFMLIKMTNFSLINGLGENSTLAFIGFGTACVRTGDLKTGSMMEKVALDLAEQSHSHSVKSKAYYGAAIYLNHWMHHYKTGVEYLLKAYRYGMESGELTQAGVALVHVLQRQYFSGVPLESVYNLNLDYLGQAKKFNNKNIELFLKVIEQLILNIRGLTENPFSFGDNAIKESELKEKVLNSNSDVMIASFPMFKVHSLYLQGDYRGALEEATAAAKKVDSIKWQIIWAEFIFYYSLAITAISGQSIDRRKHWRILNKNRRLLKKWSGACPANFLHKYFIVEAEVARLQGRDRLAMGFYDQAMRSSQQYGFIQNASIAGELAAGFYFSRGIEEVGKVFLTAAHQGYKFWGAGVKVGMLEERYPWLKSSSPGSHEAATVDDSSGNRPWPGDMNKAVADSGSPWDLTALLKASQVTAGDHDLEHSFNRIINLLLEHAGAQRLCLLQARGEELFLEAEKEAGSERVELFPSVPFPENSKVPVSIIRYVFGTGETVILDNASREGMFINDPYVRAKSLQSVLCFPLQAKGKNTDVLYLENNLLPATFSTAGLNVLRNLLFQAVHLKKMLDQLEEIIGRAKKTAPKTMQKLLSPLSDRELEVLRLMAGGLSNQEIAARLKLVEGTVKWHVNNIFSKLAVNRRTQAVVQARALGLLPED